MKAQPLDAATHTPTPWRVHIYGEIVGAAPSPGRCVLVVAEPNRTNPNAEANAALIVRAVNSHAALAAALEDAEFLMRQASKHAGPMQDSFKRSAEDARAALALARGNQSNP
jgi:hypothetical protein